MLLVSCFEMRIVEGARAVKVAHHPVPNFGLQTRSLSKIVAFCSWEIRSWYGCEKVCFSSRIASENILNYVDFTECACEDSL